MTKTKSLIGLIAVALVVGTTLTVVSFLYAPNLANASAPSGLPATQRVATTTEVGPDIQVKIFSRTNCEARVISTTDGTGMGVRFTMGDPLNGDLASTTLSQLNGHWQAGSTTVSYDGGLNGCGDWYAKAFASTTITVSSF